MKVYKGRQKLSLEQAASYYKHAYKIGVEHGRYTEQERIIQMLKLEFGIGVDLERTEMRDAIILSLIEQIKGEQEG